MMAVYPGINCPEIGCVLDHLKKIGEIGASVAHIDIADGKFTNFITWNNPAALRDLQLTTKDQQLCFELHLMVQNPKEDLELWSGIDIKRVIVHVDSVERDDFDLIVEHCELNNIEVVPAVNVGLSTRRILRYIDEFKFRSALVLAVSPGPSGQKFDDRALDVIRELHSRFPKLSIVVDGGVNLDVALRAKEAGADTLVSTSYVWESKNPAGMLHKLQIV